MQLLKYCVEYGGALLVDSTRKGKKFPDRFVTVTTIEISPCRYALTTSTQLFEDDTDLGLCHEQIHRSPSKTRHRRLGCATYA
jgi:hypothetical protein